MINFIFYCIIDTGKKKCIIFAGNFDKKTKIMFNTIKFYKNGIR
jgi:hypothetical protein